MPFCIVQYSAFGYISRVGRLQKMTNVVILGSVSDKLVHVLLVIYCSTLFFRCPEANCQDPVTNHNLV